MAFPVPVGLPTTLIDNLSPLLPASLGLRMNNVLPSGIG